MWRATALRGEEIIAVEYIDEWEWFKSKYSEATKFKFERVN